MFGNNTNTIWIKIYESLSILIWKCPNSTSLNFKSSFFFVILMEKRSSYILVRNWKQFWRKKYTLNIYILIVSMMSPIVPNLSNILFISNCLLKSRLNWLINYFESPKMTWKENLKNKSNFPVTKRTRAHNHRYSLGR